jgi:phage terminase large subunit-like protein
MTPQTAPAQKSFLLSEREIELIDRELDWLRENDRFQFYEPCGQIEKFLGLVGNSDNLLFILSAANGIGKTTVLVNLARSLMFGADNKYFRHPTIENWPFPKRIRFVSEPSQVGDSGPLATEIHKWWPKGRYQEFKGGHNYVSLYKAGEWILEVMTYEQLPEQHEGANLGLVMFNEPPPKNLWTPNISRLRAGGMAVVGMTPLTEAGWIFDDVVPRHEQFIVYADVEAACKQHGIRGHLEHSQIEKMIAEYDHDEREARIEGKALYLKGLIYKQFSTHVHVLKETVLPPANATIFQSVDPHSDKPFASLWAFVDARGDVYIYDEWPNIDFYKWRNCQLSIPEYVQIFRDKEQGHPAPTKRIIDRHFAEVSHLSGMTRKTLRDEFRDVGVDFTPSYQALEEVDTGIAKVREYLTFNSDRPMDWTNKPKLFINPHCVNTIKSFQRWSRDPKTGKVQDEHKDFMDCVRYLLMADPVVDEPVPYNPPRKMW